MDRDALDALPRLAHQDTDWSRVRSTTYLVRQLVRYEYPGPIRDLRQRLQLIPPQLHGDQRRLAWGLDVSLPARRREWVDEFGNLVVHLEVDAVDTDVTFEAWSMVERHPEAAHPMPAAPAALTTATPLTTADGPLAAAASELAGTASGVELAEGICDWVHGHLEYGHDVTSIHTSAARALALGAGVCQDYAHIALALCRHAGLAARYVSGHLLGEGGSHAWIEVMVPDPSSSGWRSVALDPTHNRSAGLTYVTVATGRDYMDVAPTSGSYRALVAGVLSVRKQAALVSVVYHDE